MAPDEKPYRVYRGGRVKGKVPAPTKQRPGKTSTPRRAARTTTTPRKPWWKRGVRLRRPPWKRVIAIGLIAFLTLFVVWGVTSFLSVRSGVDAANDRLQRGSRAALTKQDGLLLSNESTILLLGTDFGPQPGRAGNRHSDSIILLRTDPSHHRLAYLSIPRDLYVPVRGLGDAKINAAFQAGGVPLATRTIRDYTGLDINHVVVVDFSNFEELIDAVGGVTIDVPAPILSNKFDCPFKTDQRCQQWKGWRFAKGKQHMDGRRALIYSRIRENQLNPRETDFTRAARQQAVMTAATSKLTAPSTLTRLPFSGDDMLKPLATDLTAWQIMQLGWVKTRASGGNTLYCRLGGDPSYAGGQSVIMPSEDNRNAIAMWRGDSAPQRPATTYGPGCAKGRPIR